MGDAGEGLIDADARIAERMDEQEQARAKAKAKPKIDPERFRQTESLRLARTELEHQLASTSHATRREQITNAIAEIDKRLAAIASAQG